MKINHYELTVHLEKKLFPLYILSGDDPVLLNETLSQIISFAQKKEFYDIKKIEYQSHFDWPAFFADFGQMSLFAEKEIVQLNFLTNKLNTETQNYFKKIHEYLNPNKILILTFPKFESNQTNLVWLKTLEKEGFFVVIWPLQGASLLKWLNDKLKQKKLVLESEAIKLMIEYSENNLVALQQFIEKLSLTFPSQTRLSVQQVFATLTPSSKYSLYDLVEPLLNQDSKKLLKILHHLFDEGAEFPLLLWLLTKELRTIYQLSSIAPSDQKAFYGACKKLGVWDKRIPLYQNAVKKHNKTSLKNLFSFASAIDIAIKENRVQEIEKAIVQLALALAGNQVIDFKYYQNNNNVMVL